MKSPFKLMLALILGIAVVTVGCQPKKDRDRTRIGRTARGATGPVVNGVPTSRQPSLGTQWGEITSTNARAFQDELYYFTAPMLNGASQEDWLGSVSAQSGQQTGVVFWGNAPMTDAGVLDGNRARLHIEIFDDKTGVTRSDNSVRPQIVVHIGYDQEGFVSAQGSYQGNQAYLNFKDGYGSVILKGTWDANYFSGQVYYTTNDNLQERQLGNFRVPTCGFFVCKSK